MTSEVLRQWLPIGISAISLAIACLALGWNIYRDVILRARVEVWFGVVQMFSPGVGAQGGPQLNITVTNHGPGPVTIQGIVGRKSPWWRTLLRRPKHFVILNDHTNLLNPRLPAKLEVGDRLNLFLPHDAKSFLSTDATHIGVNDTFGRSHFAKSRDLALAKESYRKDFTEAGS